ncbi:hypothetical protein HYH02_008978 [Chlamydomonas schloesseri]|uniref:Serine protease n=1 Tax=Chlamydomonas schloesseri TaxID=2026947 RepID=A0A835WD57_9CHLO|nr:hypothetical protein HYH02_008978 [Chlamydomonas schloesseri]|eukprot:KAG2445111.1 hypothetical protein HYH02_008978 [Chlamydomonas schloesseri]
MPALALLLSCHLLRLAYAAHAANDGTHSTALPLGALKLQRRGLLLQQQENTAQSPGQPHTASLDSSSSSNSFNSSASSPANAAHGPAPTAAAGTLPSLRALTRAPSPAPHPLRLVGQLRNGCTAFLAGPCHVVTVAHCVYEPDRDVWWPGLEFSTGAAAGGGGRNGAEDWEPQGTVTWRATEVPEGWKRRRRSGGGGGGGGGGAHTTEAAVQVERFDFAVVVLAEPLGRRLGWMDVGCGSNGGGDGGGDGDGDGSGGGGGDNAGEEPCGDGVGDASADGSGDRGDAKGQWVQVAGYPDDRPNGTLWTQRCRLLALPRLRPQLPPPSSNHTVGLWGDDAAVPAAAGSHTMATATAASLPPPMLTVYHDCDTRGGNSGSPMWRVAASAPAASPTGQPACGAERSGRPRALAMHVAGESRRRWDGSGRLAASSRRGVAVSFVAEAAAQAGARAAAVGGSGVWVDTGAAEWIRAAIARHADC